LAKGDKALVGNTGYRRYLKTISQEHFAIDPNKVEEEKKFDGIFVLRTNPFTAEGRTDGPDRRSGPIASFRTAENSELFCRRTTVKSATDLPLGA
jgi:hypothetical protein